MSLKKGQLYTGKVTEYKFPNSGKVETEDGCAWVKDTLPGQEVSFYVSKKSSGISKGRLNEVIKRSDIESEDPGCGQFGRCGGCTYRRLKYEDQLKLKSCLAEKLLREVYSDFLFEGICASPEVSGYRNKMEFTFGDETKGGRFALGMHRKGSFHDVVNVDDCLIVPKDFNIIKNAVRDFFEAYYEAGKVDFHNNMTHRGYLRHLLLRRSASSGDILVALVTATPSESDRVDDDTELTDEYVKMLRSLKLSGRIAGAFHVYNNALSDVVRSDRTDLLFGEDHITEEILGLKFKISLFSFFQTNSKGAEELYSKVREYASSVQESTQGQAFVSSGTTVPGSADPCIYSDQMTKYFGERGTESPEEPEQTGNSAPQAGYGIIYDLYSGTGTISQLMSPVASRVIGIEIVEEAVEAAKENAGLNGISNVTFIAGDVMKILCGEEGEKLPRPDFIILDPPREGIHPKALRKILDNGFQNIIYVSCKPTSLAEELLQFKAAGYDLKKAACIDMFPGTVHVETCALLAKSSEA